MWSVRKDVGRSHAALSCRGAPGLLRTGAVVMLALLRVMPKPVRRYVGRWWSDLARGRAEAAYGDDGPFCDLCGNILVWLPWHNTFMCAYEANPPAELRAFLRRHRL